MECREPQAGVFQGEECSGRSLGTQVGGWLGRGSHRRQGDQLGDNGWWFRLDGGLPEGGETRLDERKNVGFERERAWLKGFDWSYPKQRAPLSCLTRRIEGWSRPQGRW